MKNRILNYKYTPAKTNENNLAIILIHAYPVNGKMWGQQDCLSEHGLDVYSYDMFGFGESASSNDEGDYSVENSVSDLEDFIELVVKKPVVICGLSLGAYISLNMATRKNRLIKGLILNSIGAGSDNPTEFFDGVMSWAEAYKKHDIDAFLVELMKDELFGYIENKSPNDYTKIRSMIIENSKEGVINTACKIIATRPTIYEYKDKIKALDMPVLIMAGSLDKDCIEPSKFIDYHAAKSSYIEFPGCGHFINMEADQKFNNHIVSFLLEHRIIN